MPSLLKRKSDRYGAFQIHGNNIDPAKAVKQCDPELRAFSASVILVFLDRLPLALGPMNRRHPRCRERDAVPRRKRVAGVVLFVVEAPRLDAVLAVVHELATDPCVAVQELVEQFAVRGDARPWRRREGRVVFVSAHSFGNSPSTYSHENHLTLTSNCSIPDRRSVRDGRILLASVFRSHAMPDPVVFRKTNTMRCTCLTHTAERVEVRLSVRDVVIHREFFTDHWSPLSSLSTRCMPTTRNSVSKVFPGQRAAVVSDNPTTAPSLRCPTCDRDLDYVRSITSGVQPVERWDQFTCPACGPYEYRHRTRKLRVVL